MSLNSVITRDDVEITKAQLGYLSGRALYNAFDAIISAFEELEKSDDLTKAFVARRLGKRPEQVTRWLSGPNNMTLETYSHIFAALGREPVFGSYDLVETKKSNVRHSLCDTKQSATLASYLLDVKASSDNNPPGLEPPGRAVTLDKERVGRPAKDLLSQSSDAF